MSSTEKVKAKIAEAQDIFPTNKVITIENLKEWLEQKHKKIGNETAFDAGQETLIQELLTELSL